MISVSSLGSNEGNYHDIDVFIDSSPLRPHITSESEASCHRLFVIVNGFKKFTFDWPWSSSLALSLRLGTHVIDVGLERVVQGSMEENDWYLVTPYSRSMFEIIPNYNESVINETSLKSLDHRMVLPAEKAIDCVEELDRQEERKVRIALVGPLQISGQNLLALEQGRRLRHLCVKDDLDLVTKFEVSYFSNARNGGVFVDLLRDLK